MRRPPWIIGWVLLIGQPAIECLLASDKQAAIAKLKAILANSGLESRHDLEAWTALRNLGVKPTAVEGSQVLGVVVEVGMPGGTDVLAAYADGSACYNNFSGSGVVWERPNTSLDAVTKALLTRAEGIRDSAAPLTGPRPGPHSPPRRRVSSP